MNNLRIVVAACLMTAAMAGCIGGDEPVEAEHDHASHEHVDEVADPVDEHVEEEPEIVEGTIEFDVSPGETLGSDTGFAAAPGETVNFTVAATPSWDAPAESYSWTMVQAGGDGPQVTEGQDSLAFQVVAPAYVVLQLIISDGLNQASATHSIYVDAIYSGGGQVPREAGPYPGTTAATATTLSFDLFLPVALVDAHAAGGAPEGTEVVLLDPDGNPVPGAASMVGADGEFALEWSAPETAGDYVLEMRFPACDDWDGTEQTGVCYPLCPEVENWSLGIGLLVSNSSRAGAPGTAGNSGGGAVCT